MLPPFQGSQQAVRVGGKIKNVVLIGLGKVEDAALEAKWGLSLFQTLGAAAAAAAKTTKARTLALALTQLPPVDEVQRRAEVSQRTGFRSCLRSEDHVRLPHWYRQKLCFL